MITQCHKHGHVADPRTQTQAHTHAFIRIYLHQFTHTSKPPDQHKYTYLDRKHVSFPPQTSLPTSTAKLNWAAPLLRRISRSCCEDCMENIHIYRSPSLSLSLSISVAFPLYQRSALLEESTLRTWHSALLSEYPQWRVHKYFIILGNPSRSRGIPKNSVSCVNKDTRMIWGDSSGWGGLFRGKCWGWWFGDWQVVIEFRLIGKHQFNNFDVLDSNESFSGG